MSNRTINLYDGLEALYYFDSAYFNSGTNELSDKSGHERHATASGGPTLGAVGPNDFEAASFDGSDDEFIINDGSLATAMGNANEITMACLVADWTESNKSFVSYGDFGADLVTGAGGSGSIAFELWDASASLFSQPQEGPHLIVGTYDQENIRVIFDNEETSLTEYTGGQRIKDGNPSSLMNTNTQSRNQEGDMIFAGYWTRVLSDAEIEQLNRLTAPRRSNL